MGVEGPAGRRQHGFTLIEALVALSVFAVGVLAVISMQENAMSGSARGRWLTGASTVAMDRVEYVLSLDPSTSTLLEDPPASGPGTNARNDGADNDNDGAVDEADETYTVYSTASDGIDNDGDGAVDEDGEAGGYTVQWRVTSDSPVAGAKSVQVVISHPQLDNTVTFSLVLAGSL